MKIGLIGYTQSGKTTLFQAITGAQPDPSLGMKGQSALCMVEDERLNFLATLFNPVKKTFATVEFVDIPGLTPKDESFSQRVSTAKNSDAFIFVLDAFTSKEVSSSLKSLREEFILSDIVSLSTRADRLEDAIKKGKSRNKDQDSKELKDLRSIIQSLEQGEKPDFSGFSSERMASLRGFQLFSLKPELVVINCDESDISRPVSYFIEDSDLLSTLSNAVVLSSKLELDLTQLDDESRLDFMKDLGVSSLAKNRLIQEAYRALGLSSFFTVGEDECKAWTIPVGASALEAAGKIHSDIARGFIRAEVVDFECMKEYKSMKDIKAKGLYRLEGKEYQVKDGDIINFRFNV